MEIQSVLNILVPAIVLIVLTLSVVVLTAVFTISSIEAYIMSGILLVLLMFSLVIKKVDWDISGCKLSY